MKLVMHRDSVATEENFSAPHEKISEIPDTMTYLELHRKLFQENYYPAVEGNNAVWVLTAQNYWDIYSYFTKTGAVFPNQKEEYLNKLSPDGNFYMKYYPSPEAWKQEILKHFNGNQRLLYLEGWANEYLYCETLMKEK